MVTWKGLAGMANRTGRLADGRHVPPAGARGQTGSGNVLRVCTRKEVRAER